jgi:hypothetical protein
VLESIQTAILHWPPSQGTPVPHARHAAPFNPHVALPPGWQTPLASQQPLGQEFASHTHTSLTHSWPVAHETHAAPPELPHAALASPGWQLPLASQQPFGQESASQTHAPATHSWPVPHATHAAPSAPHAAFVVGFTQVAPSQQPVAQSAELQYATQL